ncbi:AAA family ATPase [Oceanobacillus massiliensis]|uniref:AAA family ATPase n=1 Tax=Oceanobacillus massiliensis TaxID=1465765 RepID=UPI000289C761|nr:MoxR family ATPase [Oceanobacillus massiliensis]
MTMLKELSHSIDEVNKVIYGQEEVVELLFVALLSGGHVILESAPGSGKTKLAKCFAKVINGDFSRVQFTPDVLPSDVTGIQFFNPKTQEFELKVGPVKTNILLADEINRATPRTQSSLLEVMEESQTTIEGETINIPSPFLVIATQNPIENSQGTFPLPEAQLDRFMLKINIDYPSYETEKQLLANHQLHDPLERVLPILSKSQIISLQEETGKIKVSEVVLDYVLKIVRKTRSSNSIEVGASSRAALSLIRAAKSRAFMKGRNYVTPEDIKKLIPFVLAHRLVLTMDESLRNSKVEVLRDLVNSIDVPVEWERNMERV